jgi:hypothetical protein
MSLFVSSTVDMYTDKRKWGEGLHVPNDFLYSDFMSFLSYGPSKLTGMNFTVLNSDTIYFSIIFANRIERTQFIKFIYKVKLNVKTCVRVTI